MRSWRVSEKRGCDMGQKGVHCTSAASAEAKNRSRMPDEGRQGFNHHDLPSSILHFAHPLRVLGVCVLSLLFLFPALAAPTSGPYEQTVIRRKEGTAAPTQPRGVAGASQSPWEMAKVPVALGGVLVLIFMMRWLGRKMMTGPAAR